MHPTQSFTDVQSLAELTRSAFLEFVMSYSLSTKFGTASMDLCKAGEYESAERICWQWIAICDASALRGPEGIDAGLLARTKYLQFVCLGNISLYQGNYQDAEEWYTQALGFAQKVSDVVGVDAMHLNRAVVFQQQGKFLDALRACETALDVNTQTQNLSLCRSAILTTLGISYGSIGYHDRALDFHMQALEEMYDEEGSDHIGTIVNNIAVELLEAGDTHAAKSFLLAQLEADSPPYDAYTRVLLLSNLGKVHFLLQEYCAATEYYRLAAYIAAEHGFGWHHVGLLLSMGEAMLFEGSDIQGALSLLNDALEASKASLNSTYHIESLMYLGFAHEMHLADLRLARRYYEEAAEVLEQQRLLLGVEHFKIAFMGSKQSLYDRLVSVCLGMNDVDGALQWVERSKAKAFLDSLFDSIGDPMRGNASYQGDEKAASLYAQIANARMKLDTLYGHGSAMGRGGRFRFPSAPEGPAEGIEQAIKETEERYLALLEQLQLVRPGPGRAFAGYEPLLVPDIKTALGESSSIIQLYQCPDSLLAFHLMKDGPVVCEIVDLGADDAYDQVMEVLENLHHPADTHVFSHEFLRDVRAPLAHLYDKLRLVFEGRCSGMSKVIIIPHTFWHVFPFHALFDSQRNEYLIDRFEIAYVPAASLLRRTVDPAAMKRAVLFGNPTGDLPRASSEIEQIFPLFAEAPGRYEGPDATRQRFLATSKDADIVHVAAHGEFRPDKPLLSFMLFAGPDGTAERLTALDLLDHTLTPSLVTLSGCETGLMDVLPGDEIMGFPRALLIAGAKSLVTSLWAVEDASTSLLMTHFYQSLLHERLTVSSSLRRAVLALKAIPEFAHPFFWAPFILIGESNSSFR